MQGRFAHMFKPGNEWMIEEVQKEVDKRGRSNSTISSQSIETDTDDNTPIPIR